MYNTMTQRTQVNKIVNRVIQRVAIFMMNVNPSLFGFTFITYLRNIKFFKSILSSGSGIVFYSMIKPVFFISFLISMIIILASLSLLFSMGIKVFSPRFFPFILIVLYPIFDTMNIRTIFFRFTSQNNFTK